MTGDLHDKKTMLINPQTNGLAFRIALLKEIGDFQKFGGFNFYSIFLVLRGNGRIRVDLSHFTFTSDNFICLSLYQPFQLISEEPFEALLINFHPDFFCIHKHHEEVACNGVLFNAIYETPVVSVEETEMQELRNLVEMMQAEMQQVALAQYEFLISYLKIFLITASRQKLSRTLVKRFDTRKEPLQLQLLKEAIEHNFKQWHSPAKYAQALNITAKSLNRLVKKHFNKTLTNLIAERVLVEAKRELYLTTKPIKTIAAELGFEDEFYFSRVFKNQAGVSAKVYRERIGSGKGEIG
jgi:AraC family transcriptional activator of pobA